MFQDDEELSSHVMYRGGQGSVGVITHGEGATIWDRAGNEYIDAMGGVAVQIVGHGNASVANTISKATRDYSFAYAQSFTTSYQEELAGRLVARLSLPSQSGLYFGSGGSDANEMAIKFARQYHLTRGEAKRYKILGMRQAYHGNTLGTLAVSDRPSWRVAYDPYLYPSPKIGRWLTRRELRRHNSEKDLTAVLLEEAERLLWSEGPETISAFIFEPYSGSSVAGARHPHGFLEEMADLCARYGILMIADEVFCGYGRVGRPLASSLYGVEPDIVTLGKGLGSGYAALSACVLSPSVREVLGGADAKHQQGYTFSGLPLACAAGIAVSDYIDEHSLFDRASRLGEILHAKMRSALEAFDSVSEVRGRGMLVGLEFVRDNESLSVFDRTLNVAGKVADFCRQRGVIVAPGTPDVAGFEGGDQIHLAPPYVISEAQIDRVVDVVSEAVDAVVEN